MTQALLRPPETPACDAFATLDAMAHMARQTQSVVHVVSPRGPGLVERARLLGIQAGLDVEADIMPATVRVRFSPRSSA